MRAKERTSSFCTFEVARRDGPVRPVRHHAAHGRAPVLGALAGRGVVGGALSSGSYEPWRVEETGRTRQGGRPDPLVGSAPGPLGSYPGARPGPGPVRQ